MACTPARARYGQAVSPRARAVLVYFIGAVIIERAVAHVLATQWPAGALEVVVVDNASADGSADRLARRFPQVQLRRSTRNLGFAGGTNLGLLDLRHVDHVALVNSDAFVSPGWLEPLVEAVESEPAVGAACPKILFASRSVELELRADPHVPGGNDPRQLGVR